MILFSKIKTSRIYRKKKIVQNLVLCNTFENHRNRRGNNLSATSPNFYDTFNLVQPILTALIITRRGSKQSDSFIRPFQIPRRATANQSSGTRVTRRKFPMARSLAAQVAAITVPARLSRFDYSIKSNERYIRKRSVTKTTVNIGR